MGCVTSAPSDVEDAKLREITAKQRRRLSLAPEKVGDTTQTADPEAEQQAQVEEDKDNQNGSDEKEVLYIRVSHFSKKGVVPYNRNKVNQDRYIVQHALCSDSGMSLFGVMDGHGEFGHLVADYVKVNFPMLLEQESIRADPCASILSAMKKLCANLQTTGINVNFSGTTAIIGLKVDDMMYIANIGDSRCVLARKSQTGDYIEAVPLSTDHKPDVPTEKARILAAGGRVCPLPGPEDEDRGPDRVWLEKVDVPGLAMSRSIGDDISQQVGVISVPEITQYRISRNDLFVVWASDGVWEFVSNEDAVATVAQHLPNLGDATRALVSLSTQRWKMNEEVIDDITTVIVQF